MAPRRMGTVVGLLALISGLASAQQQRTSAPVPQQTPREALVEKLTGGDASFKKHLTTEVQQKLQALETVHNQTTPPAKPSPATSALAMLTLAQATGAFQTFLSGPVLFSIENAAQRQSTEVRIDRDQLRGEAADMELSVHSFRDGKEEVFPITFGVLLGWKQQQSIWRLDTITLNAKLPVGDPKLYDPGTWAPAMRSLGGQNANHNLPLGMGKQAPAQNVPPK